MVGTSGSTGVAKLALLTAPALRASAAGTEEVLGGPGQWLLAVPAHHIAGMQVLLRSVLAGTQPVVLDRAAGFTSEAFAAATARLSEQRAYTSLVPTQLTRLLEEPSGLTALRRYAAVLVGGAALSPALRARADASGVRLVTTYGMSETAGGCIYDGRPLPGARVELTDEGRIRLGGATLAAGYLGDPPAAAAFETDPDGSRWLRTDDLGARLPDGRLQVLGRADDVIVTGALKVHPRIVEDALLAAYPRLHAAAAVGIPDPEWGQVIAVVLVGAPELDLADVRERLRADLPAYALPRRLRHTDALPERGPGKPDRRAIAAWVGQ